jgi:hypothetical protein
LPTEKNSKDYKNAACYSLRSSNDDKDITKIVENISKRLGAKDDLWKNFSRYKVDISRHIK